jgi:hypothetical protein
LIEKQVILWPGKALTAFYLYIMFLWLSL